MNSRPSSSLNPELSSGGRLPHPGSVLETQFHPNPGTPLVRALALVDAPLEIYDETPGATMEPRTGTDGNL